MTDIILNVRNETDQLKTVVLGQPESPGHIPALDEVYDAKSCETVKNGTYPSEEDIKKEMTAFERVLCKHGVEVLRPSVLKDCNQVFARDVAFVIDDKMVVSNIIPDRVDEQEAYAGIFKHISFNKIFNLPEKAHVEGGDVVLFDEFVFVGVYKDTDYPQLKTARTNMRAVDFLKELFDYKTIYPMELIKNDVDPYDGILHLDCTFMPVGRNKAVIYKQGFKNERDYRFLVNMFGKENVFEITREEMYSMNSNIFSISPEVVVVEENFSRLSSFLEESEMTVERIPYREISKMGGLLRCSTLPLTRESQCITT